MATDLIPLSPAPSSDAQTRIPAIAADLLPPEIIAARRTRRLRRGIISILVVVLVLLGAWQAAVIGQTAAARSRLDTAQQEVLRLQHQQNAYGDLVRAQSGAKLIESQLAVLMADDLQWARLLGSLRTVAPPGVRVTGLNGSLNSAPGGTGTGTGTGTDQLPGATGEKQIGTLTITGTGSDNRAVAAYVDALGAVRGLGSPLLTGTTHDKGTLQFTIRVNITDAALGGRYTKAKNGSAGN